MLFNNNTCSRYDDGLDDDFIEEEWQFVNDADDDEDDDTGLIEVKPNVNFYIDDDEEVEAGEDDEEWIDEDEEDDLIDEDEEYNEDYDADEEDDISDDE
jgi:hypothetical protein